MTDDTAPPADAFAMTPAEATAALMQKSEAYNASQRGPMPPANSSAGARLQLDALTRSTDFQAKLAAGDPSTRRQFADLCAAVASGDATADALAPAPELPADVIETTTTGQLSTNALRREVADLRRAGFGDDVIRQMVDGRPVSATEKEMAVRLRALRLGDAAFVARYLAGDAAARLEMGHLSILIAADVAT
jgi:hypothetical protein